MLRLTWKNVGSCSRVLTVLKDNSDGNKKKVLEYEMCEFFCAGD